MQSQMNVRGEGLLDVVDLRDVYNLDADRDAGRDTLRVRSHVKNTLGDITPCWNLGGLRCFHGGWVEQQT